jgi:dynein heavy chain
LGKLQSTAEEVKILQASLEEMKPALEAAARDADIMIAAIAEDQVVAEETKEVVEKEEIEAAKMTLETQTIADDAQRDLG